MGYAGGEDLAAWRARDGVCIESALPPGPKNCLSRIFSAKVPAMSWKLFALGSAFFAGLTAIFGKLGVEGMNSNLATFIRTVVILVITAAIVSIQGEWRFPQKPLEMRPVVFLILSGFATGFSWLFYYRALQMAPASLVAPVDKLSVVFAIALGVLFLGEAVTPRLIIGGSLIIAGSMVLIWPWN